MRHSSRLLVLLSGAMLLAPSVLRAQAAPAQKRSDRLTIQDYLDWEDVQDPQLSPDGKQIVFTRRWIDKMNDKWESSVWIMNADGSRARFLVNGSDVKWSPDGTRIAYTATPAQRLRRARALHRAHRSSFAGWTPRALSRRSRT